MEQQKTELDIEQRIEQLKKITRQDGAEKYAEAQFELGRIYYEYKKDWQKAKKHLLNIKKQDNPKDYAQAQLYLGITYQYEKQDIKKAIRYYLNVEKQDNPKLYAEAQLNLGFIFQVAKYNIDMAIQFYLNVQKYDNSKAYAEAQLNLGIIYHNEKYNIEMAEYCYLNVKKEDNPKAYAQAQLNLGVIYQKVKYNIKQAEEYYINVKKQDNREVYAQAQLHLGFIYQYKYNNFKWAEKYYLSIEKQDNAAAYAWAQLNLGIIYQDKYNNFERAEQCYSNIEKQDNAAAYASAQFNLGIIYQDKYNNFNRAKKYYSSIEKQDNSAAYASAQFNLGLIYQDKTKDINQAEEYYQNVAYSDDSFKRYIIAQMMLSVIRNKKSSIFEQKQRDDLAIKICDIRDLTNEIQKELLVKFNLNESENNDGQVFERQVAHYTKPEVLFNLLKNKPSNFRLNVIDFMNDPTESQVLTDLLKLKPEKNNKIKIFLTSFTFNHNSLNQFRLYGNENNIVGSSVSVVFNNKFFGESSNININLTNNENFLNNINLGLPINDSAKSLAATMEINVSNEIVNNKNDKIENNLNENSVQKNAETIVEKNITSSVGLLPLYRCLYLDPKNGYISIAKRNKYSFYLEHQSDSDEDIDAKWNNYLGWLKEKEKIITIGEKLKQIKNIIHSLKNPEKPKQKEIIEKIINLDQLIALALMPISCLVKHAAFEDEDECRIIYITNIDDKNIQTPNEYALINRLYLNYSNVEGYIEKIYLGPRCQSDPELWITNRAQTLKSNLTNEPIKVIKSQMPLR